MMTTPILQPGKLVPEGRHYLPATPDTTYWGELPCRNDSAIDYVAVGERITIDTLSHEGLLEDQGSDPRAFFGLEGIAASDVLHDAIELVQLGEHDPDRVGPHVVTGPVGVRGAQPGDYLKVSILEATPRVPYGVISNRHGRGALPTLLPHTRQTVSVFADVVERQGLPYGRIARQGIDMVEKLRRGAARDKGSVEFALAPFPGILGVASNTRQRQHSVPPGIYGGNLDINLMTVGSIVYLPVQVPEALFYVGDPHFAQADGEVSLTALEASLRVTVALDVLSPQRAAVQFGGAAGPLVETPDYIIPTGLDADLNVAVERCVQNALLVVQARWGLDEAHAYAYLSAATDFHISQVVDRVKGVHACIRKADFSERRYRA